MKTSELFKKEINFIKNEHLRNIVANTLDASPECIQTIAASSSGKYHPKYSLGEGGLVRHTKATVGIAWSLIESDVLKGLTDDKNDKEFYEDVVYASLILHDCCKPDDTPEHHTRFDHPLIGADLFAKISLEYIKNIYFSKDDKEHMKALIIMTFKCIQSHMGKYTTSSYVKNIVLPKPENNLEWFVHLCDLLSSRKYIEFNFDKYYETLK